MADAGAASKAKALGEGPPAPDTEEVDSDESEPLLRDAVPPPKVCGCLTAKYALGLAMIGAVVVIWVAASAIVQYIYDDLNWNGPFFLTYVCTALFTVYWPIVACTAVLRKRDLERAHSLSSMDGVASEGAQEPPPQPVKQLTLRQTARAALIICPMWFLANYTYNASLAYTSVTVNTILSTASSLFTFVLSVLLLGERATWVKVAGVAVAMAGASAVGLESAGADDGRNTIGGDALCLFAGFMYGAYCVGVRKLLPDDDGVDMPTFFGFVGVFNTVMFGGIVLALHFSGVEPLQRLSGHALALIVLKGLADNVLSDYLWARAVLLTSPTVSTVGLSLTVPLAMLSDLLVHGDMPSAVSVLGATLVIIGFIGVNVGDEAPPVEVCGTHICGDKPGQPHPHGHHSEHPEIPAPHHV